MYARPLLAPLAFFLAGLICMGVGTMISLVKDARTSGCLERAQTVLDITLDDVKTPVEQVGFTLRDWRTNMALASGTCFIAGCLIGYAQLLIATL